MRNEFVNAVTVPVMVVVMTVPMIMTVPVIVPVLVAMIVSMRRARFIIQRIAEFCVVMMHVHFPFGQALLK